MRDEAGQRCHGTTREQPLTQFLATERALLKPLPVTPPVLAVWAKVKVHRDAHVQFAQCLYSVPFRLVGQTLWLKASDTLIRLYQEHEPVACHALIHTLFADRVLVHLRAAQGILRLEPSYGALRLEAACARALDAGSARYRTVKTILAKNLDQTSVPGATTPLPATYTQGGRFCRDPQTSLH